jgi:hypothetical protein
MNRLQLLWVAAFGLGIAVWESGESIHLLAALPYPVVEGEVISREPFKRFGGIDAGRLKVRIVGSNTVVTAETNRPDLKNLPHCVRFRYTGDPGREVFLWGEENPVWVALFLYIASGVILLVVLAPVPRRNEAGGKACGGPVATH